MKKITPELKQKCHNAILRLLLAGADRSVNRKEGPETWFQPDNPYRAEAFGILRGLNLLDLGYFGADNVEDSHIGFNLKYWFNQIEEKARQMCEEMGPKQAYHWAIDNISYE